MVKQESPQRCSGPAAYMCHCPYNNADRPDQEVKPDADR